MSAVDKSEGSTSIGTFQYTGLSKLDKRSPKYRLLASKQTMTVREFVCFYCGIDEDAVNVFEDRDIALNSYILPFEELIKSKAELMKDKNALADEIPF